MKLTELHQDERGSIKILTEEPLTVPEVTVFETKAGYARGGCVHNMSDEYTTIIEGTVKYNIRGREFRLQKGDSAKIPKNHPHYFISVTDSIVLEWGATPEEKANKDMTTRVLVDRINQAKSKENK